MDRWEPATIPMFPLGRALLPGDSLPLRVFEPRYRALLTDTLGEYRELLERREADPDVPTPTLSPPGFGVVLISQGHEVGGGDIRYDVGTYADIAQMSRRPDGQASLSCVGGNRFRVVEWLPEAPYPLATVQPLPNPPVTAEHRAAFESLCARVATLLDEFADNRGIAALALNPVERAIVDLSRLDEALHDELGVAGWAARFPLGSSDRQLLLEADDADTQLRILDDAVDGLAAAVEFAR